MGQFVGRVRSESGEAAEERSLRGASRLQQPAAARKLCVWRARARERESIITGWLYGDADDDCGIDGVACASASRAPLRRLRTAGVGSNAQWLQARRSGIAADAPGGPGVRSSFCLGCDDLLELNEMKYMDCFKVGTDFFGQIACEVSYFSVIIYQLVLNIRLVELLLYTNICFKRIYTMYVKTNFSV